MGYNIPYFSDYQNWYGVPQNVSRLYAVLEQTTDDDGNFVGRITASWDIPDNGGTFILLTSTDGTDFYIAKENIKGNAAKVDVLPNTDYYIKIVTLLGSERSEGTVSGLLSVDAIPIPNEPVLTVSPGGFRIDIGIIPQGYTARISISDGETVDYIETSDFEYMYLCNAGDYDVSVAFMDKRGNIGEYSDTASVRVEELATKEYVDNNFVRKTSHFYIKMAEVNGSSLMLTTGDNQQIIFQGGGTIFEPVTQEGDTITLPRGVMDGIVKQEMISTLVRPSRMLVLSERGGV
jgi:hypothetical protein